jgi:hypothetical protein
MKSPRYNRYDVLHAAQEACLLLPVSSRKSSRLIVKWDSIVERMKVLAKANKKEAKLLSTFASEIGDKLHMHDNKHLSRAVNGEWMELLTKILNAVVSAETKKKRLNCATCDPADFPVLLAVIQVMALGAPSQMWGTPEFLIPAMVGLPDFDGPYKSPEPPESHQAIAEKTWYLPQLAMLVTSIWPVELGLDYYEATMCHILNVEQDDDLDIDTGMVNPLGIIGMP